MKEIFIKSGKTKHGGWLTIGGQRSEFHRMPPGRSTCLACSSPPSRQGALNVSLRDKNCFAYSYIGRIDIIGILTNKFEPCFFFHIVSASLSHLTVDINVSHITVKLFYKLINLYFLNNCVQYIVPRNYNINDKAIEKALNL